jgi:hypothetical protein
MGTKRTSGTVYTPKGVNQGNTLIDPNTGTPVDVIEDNQGKKRLAVDASLSASGIQVQVELDASEDSVRVEDPDTGAHVKVETDGSINANTEVDAADGDNIAISAHPLQVFAENPDTLTSAVFEEIFSYTSSDNRTRLMLIECSVSTPSRIRVKLNGTVIRELWTSPLERNVQFKFLEHRPLLNGQVISVEAQVERFIHPSYDTFTSMEGYLV